MGVVYKARQLRLNRLVALKMIAAGAHASPERLARFQIEAEALASLQHPHIVQIYEVGECDKCPYIALEFVDGPSLDKRLAGTPQPPRAAAELVETLARAMYSAHQRGIVHRDLKPANILLQNSEIKNPKSERNQSLDAPDLGFRIWAFGFGLSDFTPKVTDFGLAKRLEEDSHTRPGAVMGTPAYMAPEQAEGNLRDMGPLTDVYALGAILYEMLTGRPPFSGGSPLAVLQQVRADDPVPPSRRQPKVPRDLDTICLKCLQKKPAQRFPSALALAEDLRRFLVDEPISARPVGVGERLVKWIRRRPALAALVLVSVLAVAALVGLGAWSNAALRAAADRERHQRRLAEERSQIARRAVDEMYSQVAEEWLANEPHKDLVQRAFLRKALRIYQQLAREDSDDPAVRRETGLAYYRVARISTELGEWVQADRAFDRAIALQRQLREEFPNDPAYQQELAESYNWLGELRRQSRRPHHEAEEVYQRALQVQEQLVAEYPEQPAYQADLARTHYNLGIIHMDTSQRPKARDDYEQAIALLREVTARAPKEPRYREELARALINRGSLFEEEGELERATGDFHGAIDLLQNLTKENPARPVYPCELGVTYTNLANLLFHQGHYPEAKAACREAIARLEPLTTAFPTRPRYQYELSNAFNSLGAVLARMAYGGEPEVDPQGARAEAAQNWRYARDLLKKLSDQFPEAVSYRYGLGLALGNLGWLALQQPDRLGDARSLLEEAIDHLQAALRSNPDNPVYLQGLRNQLRNLAETLIRLGEDTAAQRRADALARTPARGQGNILAAGFLAACAAAACVPAPPTTEQTARAEQYSDQAVQQVRQALWHGLSDVAPLRRAPEFAFLRQREDFQNVLREVAPPGR
jgi:tetratricopeptide (TPR) repeat protein